MTMIRELSFNEKRKLTKALAIARSIPSATVEKCGHYIWVHDTQRSDKETLCPRQKEDGQIRFKWHKTKECWYYTPRYYRKRSDKELSMDQIRMNYGSQYLSGGMA